MCCVATSDPIRFLPVTMYGTTHTHLVHMCWPLLWGLHQMGCSFATFGTYALVGSLRWIMKVHVGINAKVASHMFSLLASVEGTTVCLEIPLQSPPPRETVTWRPSPPPPPTHPGDRRALPREFARGAGGSIAENHADTQGGWESGSTFVFCVPHSTNRGLSFRTPPRNSTRSLG